MRPRVWAPSAARVDLVARRRPGPHGRRSPTAGGPPTATCPTAPTTRSPSTAATPRPDPRSAVAARRRARSEPGVRPAPSPGRDDGWPGVDARGHVLYELHVGTFTPEGTLQAAIDHLDELVDARRRPGRAHAGRAVQRRARLGLRRRGGLRRARAVRRSGRAAVEFVDAAHARGLGVCLDVVHNHLGPSGNYLGGVRAVLHRRAPHPVGFRREPRRPCRRCAAGSVDSALQWFRDFHVDALRLDAVHALIDDSPVHVLAAARPTRSRRCRRRSAGRSR